MRADHLYIGVAELPRDELLRGAGTNGANGVEVSRVVHAVMRQSESFEPIAVNVAHLSTR